MSGPRQIVRLREARLTGAGLALAAAREETRAAERAKHVAETKADKARTELTDTRDRLSRDLNDAATLLALLDRRRFDYSVAHSAMNDAVHAQQECEQIEAERRTHLIRAQARRDALVDHVETIERRDLRRREEKAELEAYDSRRTV
jgi:hypothetical protein